MTLGFLKEVIVRGAELKKLKKDHSNDSIYIEQLTGALSEAKKALAACQEAIKQGLVITGDDRELIRIGVMQVARLQKEVRKQKLLKWLGFGAAALVTWMAITN